MIFTSNFSKNGTNPLACSIAGWPPKFYVGRQYKKLAPKFWFFQKYKQDHDEEDYIRNYYSEVLSKLDPKKFLKNLMGLFYYVMKRKLIFVIDF